MTPNDMQLGSTMLGRVASVLDNDIRPERYLQVVAPVTSVASFAPLAYDFYDMNRTGKEVARYNKNLQPEEKLDPRNNDTYFHQHGMYQAAQQGIVSALMAALAGELKEKYWDTPKKRKDGMPEEKIEADRIKDLKNNYFAIKMALESNKPVDEVIKPNPTVQKIRELRNGQK